jgi:hypothetical protein
MNDNDIVPSRLSIIMGDARDAVYDRLSGGRGLAGPGPPVIRRGFLLLSDTG